MGKKNGVIETIGIIVEFVFLMILKVTFNIILDY